MDQGTTFLSVYTPIHSVDVCHKCAMDLQVCLVPLAVIHVAVPREKRGQQALRKRRNEGMQGKLNSDLTHKLSLTGSDAGERVRYQLVDHGVYRHASSGLVAATARGVGLTAHRKVPLTNVEDFR